MHSVYDVEMRLGSDKLQTIRSQQTSRQGLQSLLILSRWWNRPHRHRNKLALIIFIRDVPLQGKHIILLRLLGIKERSILPRVRFNQQKMSVPDKFGGHLIRRGIVGEAHLMVGRVCARDEQALVGKRGIAGFLAFAAAGRAVGWVAYHRVAGVTGGDCMIVER